LVKRPETKAAIKPKADFFKETKGGKKKKEK